MENKLEATFVEGRVVFVNMSFGHTDNFFVEVRESMNIFGEDDRAGLWLRSHDDAPFRSALPLAE